MTLAGREISLLLTTSNKVYKAVSTKYPNKQTKSPNTPQNPNTSYFFLSSLKATHCNIPLITFWGTKLLFSPCKVVSKHRMHS